jgi:hypothetical protein
MTQKFGFVSVANIKTQMCFYIGYTYKTKLVYMAI